MPRTVLRSGALCALILVAVCGVQAGTASAANSLSSCFTLGGRAIPVSLAGLQATTGAGRWVTISSVKLTGANGCVSYSLWGAYTRYNLRAIVAGVTPDQAGLVIGVSRYYAPGAYRGSYNLGRWETTVVRGPRVDALDTASLSPAAAVAAFSDRLGSSLNGSVLCPHSGPMDADCDGVIDTRDAYPYNFRWQ